MKAPTKIFFLAMIIVCLSCSDSNKVLETPIRIASCGDTGIKPQLKAGLLLQATEQDDVCSCDEGFLMEYQAGLCYALGYFKCSEYPASICESAGCVYESSAKQCVTQQESSCTKLLDTTTCTKDTNCTWLTKSDKTGYCRAVGGACASFTKEADCGNSYFCGWYPTLGQCISLTAACDVLSDDSSCNSTKVCYWNTSGVCETAFAACASYSKSSCEQSSWCLWNSTENACLSMTTTACSDATTADVCRKLKGCTWDTQRSYSQCLSTNFSECENASSTSCNSIRGCFWNDSANTCNNQITSSCGSVSTQGNCEGLYGCYWSGSTCISEITASCASASDSTTCEHLVGCFWDEAKCGSKVFSSCSGQNQKGCEKLTGCLWDNNATQCLSKIISSCSAASDQATCDSMSLCTWDSDKKQCLSSWSCAGSSQSSCEQSIFCGYSKKTQQCISKVWCWYYGDCN